MHFAGSEHKNKGFAALSVSLAVAAIAATLAGSALAAETVPAGTSDCKLVQIDQWPVRFAGSGWLVIDGAVNRQRVAVMLDTGAMRTAILRPVAARLGLKIDPLKGVRIVGLTGDSVAETAHVAELTIAGSTRGGWQMIVAGERDLGDGIGVILGEDFFQNVDVEFDLANRAIRLFQPRNCDGAPLAYWTTERAHEVAIEAVNSTRARIVIPVKVNGRPIVALLDTGAPRSILHRHVAGRLGVRPNTPGVVAVGTFGGVTKETSDLWIGPFESFEIGDEAIKETSIPFGDIGAEYQMLLGLDFLLAHRLLISHSQRKIYFTYAGGPVFRR
jgi:predicted aspartyl protease